MLTEDQVHKALTDLLGYDAIAALILTADQLGEASLIARGGIRIGLASTTDEGEPRFGLRIGQWT